MDAPLDALRAFLHAHPRLLVLTGAGCSTASGIPGYRDEDGAWKTRPPVRYRRLRGERARTPPLLEPQPAGLAAGGRRAPNAAHRALARLERPAA